MPGVLAHPAGAWCNRIGGPGATAGAWCTRRSLAQPHRRTWCNFCRICEADERKRKFRPALFLCEPSLAASRGSFRLAYPAKIAFRAVSRFRIGRRQENLAAPEQTTRPSGRVCALPRGPRANARRPAPPGQGRGEGRCGGGAKTGAGTGRRPERVRTRMPERVRNEGRCGYGTGAGADGATAKHRPPLFSVSLRSALSPLRVDG